MTQTTNSNKNKQGKKKKMRLSSKILLGVAIVALCAAVALFGVYLSTSVQDREALEQQQQLQDLFDNASSRFSSFSLFASACAEEEVPEAADVPAAEERVISDRFAELYNINSDVTGWLIAGEEINTALVYRDNTYYLDRDFYGKKNKAGTVFADVENVNWETDPYVVYYGHHMKNGTMFGYMIRYKKLDYFKQNTHVEIHSVYDDKVTEYVPFAIIDASMVKSNNAYFYLRRFDDFVDPADPAVIEEFIEELMDRSMYDIPGLDVTADDKIISLVTCSYDLPDGRFMVFCRELRDGETSEQMAELINTNAVLK